MMIMMTFLSHVRNNAKTSRNCVQFEAVFWRGLPQLCKLFENKDFAVRAWPGAALAAGRGGGEGDELAERPARHARYDRRFVHRAEWLDAAAHSLQEHERHGRDDPGSRRAPSGGGRRQG